MDVSLPARHCETRFAKPARAKPVQRVRLYHLKDRAPDAI